MSARVQQVAEVLWELKRAGKLGTYSLIAERAGFSAGTNGRTMITCMKKIRRDWPHLQWWRALEDSLAIPKTSEQAKALQSNGYDMEAAASDDKVVKPAELEVHMINWEELDGEAENAETSDAEEETVSS